MMSWRTSRWLAEGGSGHELDAVDPHAAFWSVSRARIALIAGAGEYAWGGQIWLGFESAGEGQGGVHADADAAASLVLKAIASVGWICRSMRLAVCFSGEAVVPTRALILTASEV